MMPMFSESFLSAHRDKGDFDNIMNTDLNKLSICF